MVGKKKTASYIPKKPTQSAILLSRKWLILSINALALAGLFSIILVLARTPIIQEIIPYRDFFHTALVVHVDLSVLVWLLSFTSLMWVYIANTGPNFNCRTAYYVSCAGTAAIVISPFVSEGNPLMNNYVPILQNPIFFLGLSLFLTGILVQAFFSTIAFAIDLKKHNKNPQNLAIIFSLVCFIIAAICTNITFNEMDKQNASSILDSEGYYELLFWGGGHVLQFTYTLVMIVAWLWLGSSVGLKTIPGNKLANIFYILTFLIVLPVPLVYYKYDIFSFEYIDFFTQHMIHGGGIAAAVIGAIIFYALLKGEAKKTSKPERNTLFFSILLFGVGGFLGHMIQGVNVVIPAHYHGSIVGVTLSLMGLTYYLLPKLGYQKVDSKLASLQPIFYGGGQLLHITGLAWSGGYGALRKTPGAIDSFEGQMGMGLMGFGGLLSVIGGLLFVIVAYKSILGKKSKPKTRKG